MLRLVGITAVFGLMLLFYISITTGLVFEDDPCGIITCGGEHFGFYEYKSIQVGESDGYAVCTCPTEPPYRLYYVSYWRKY